MKVGGCVYGTGKSGTNMWWENMQVKTRRLHIEEAKRFDAAPHAGWRIYMFAHWSATTLLKFSQSATDTGRMSWRGACQLCRRAGGS